MVGKCSVGASFLLVWLITSEIYPTNLRTQALGTCSTVGIATLYLDFLYRYGFVFSLVPELDDFLALLKKNRLRKFQDSKENPSSEPNLMEQISQSLPNSIKVEKLDCFTLAYVQFCCYYLFLLRQRPFMQKDSRNIFLKNKFFFSFHPARLFGLVCPFVSNLASLWPPLPMVVLGLPAIAAGALAFAFLPETFGAALPQNMDEARYLRYNIFKNVCSLGPGPEFERFITFFNFLKVK